MKNTQFEEYEYTIGSYFLPALFNGDYSGLEIEEYNELIDWCKYVEIGEGHWAGGSEDDHEEFTRCEVTGLGGDCHRVIWMRRV